MLSNQPLQMYGGDSSSDEAGENIGRKIKQTLCKRHTGAVAVLDFIMSVPKIYHNKRFRVNKSDQRAAELCDRCAIEVIMHF